LIKIPESWLLTRRSFAEFTVTGASAQSLSTQSRAIASFASGYALDFTRRAVLESERLAAVSKSAINGELFGAIESGEGVFEDAEGKVNQIPGLAVKKGSEAGRIASPTPFV
jgi:hypothetical protein